MLIKLKNSISFKVFLTISILFFSIITLILISQGAFFEKFYYDYKTKNLKTNVLNFKSEITIKDNTAHIPYDNIYKFEDDNNAKFAVLDSNFQYTYLNKPIDKNDASYNINEEDYTKDVITMAINHWKQYNPSYFDVVKDMETVTFEFVHPILKTKNLVVVSPLVIDNSISNIIFVISTLQPVNEATSVMKQYYIYVYLIVIILIIIFSLFISKSITKPLIKINNTAIKMASLDFSEKCSVNGDDELGVLSNSLNILSDTLNDTLTKLTVANETLTKDIEIEKELEKMRRDFISSASHELKTPISLIEGYAEGLKDNIADEESKNFYLNVIIDETKNMNDLVMDMIESSKMNYQKENSFIAPFNPYTLLLNNCTSFSEAYKSRQFILNCFIDKNILVIGNRDNIETVLRNVIKNAIHYSVDMSKISVTLTNDSTNAENILIEIENEDSHIPDEDLAFIWDKFYRVDKSHNKYSGGSGLGLSIVKSILENHASKHSLVNTNNGVKFSFTLKKQ